MGPPRSYRVSLARPPELDLSHGAHGPAFVARTDHRAAPFACLRAADYHQVAETPVEGRAAIRDMFRREFATAEMACIPEVIHEAGDVAILEWRDPLGLRGCGFFTVHDGRIAFSAVIGASSCSCGCTACRFPPSEGRPPAAASCCSLRAHPRLLPIAEGGVRAGWLVLAVPVSTVGPGPAKMIGSPARSVA